MLLLNLADSHPRLRLAAAGVLGITNSQHRAPRLFGCWPRCDRLGGAQPRMTGERIREVKEETERQLGRGTGADSFTRHPRLAQSNADGGYAPRALAESAATPLQK